MLRMCIMFMMAIMLTCAGCSKYYYQEGKSFDECKLAREQCRAELLKRSDLNNLTMQYEVEFMENCMRDKGYELFSQSQLPLDARREEPETSMHWRMKGVAGSLKK